jgi:glycosyltransferase involved in cell wall biosynthesis
MLRAALESLSQLRTNGAFSYEVVVVDNASTDATDAVVAAAAKSSAVAVRGVVESKRGIAYARNRGIREARGEWIAFFDDDQLADTGWLAELRGMADAKKVRCVGGAVHLRLPAGLDRKLTPVCRMLLGESVGMASARQYDLKVTPGTGSLLLHRSVFQEVGIFDESLNHRGEDTDLFVRIHTAGIEAWYTPAAIVHHVIPRERLGDEYLISLSPTVIEGVAKMERQTWGGLLFPLIVAARIGRAALIYVPQFLLWARMMGDREAILAARCRLAITAKYTREALPLLAPKWLGCRRIIQASRLLTRSIPTITAERLS